MKEIEKVDENLDHAIQRFLSALRLSEVEEKAILVVGGNPQRSYKSVEVLNSDGSPLCSLPDLPEMKRRFDIDDGFICGGHDGIRTKCLHYEAGNWTQLSWSLLQPRAYYVSWKRPEGMVQLIGGKDEGSSNTSEVITISGTRKGFDLMYKTVSSCGIKLDDFIIITGGKWTMSIVSKYDTIGWVKDGPSLNFGRKHHGCGHFYSDTNELFYLVAGGKDALGNQIESTEIISETGNQWSSVGNLPSARAGIRGISLNKQLFMIGGGEFAGGLDPIAEIQKFDPAGSKWDKIGNLSSARWGHGVTALPLMEIKPFCQGKFT